MRSFFRGVRTIGTTSLMALLTLGVVPGCLGILGDYEIDTQVNANGDRVESDRTPCTSETETTDCASNEECYSSFCVRRCIDAPDCGAAGYFECSSTCSIKLGNSCAVSGSCGTGLCTNIDANLNSVSPYCTLFCSASNGVDPCPSGFACVSNYCLSTSSGSGGSAGASGASGNAGSAGSTGGAVPPS
ncbi:MAG: hypothetical protein U0165_17650 [Polyangiaceae bacterium]